MKTHPEPYRHNYDRKIRSCNDYDINHQTRQHQQAATQPQNNRRSNNIRQSNKKDKQQPKTTSHQRGCQQDIEKLTIITEPHQRTQHRNLVEGADK